MSYALTFEATESLQKVRENRMPSSVSRPLARPAQGWGRTDGLYAHDGGRKYVNRSERQRVICAARKLDPERSLFSRLLAWTGARVSEVLALTPASFQIESGVVTFVTLKRRKHCVREVPIPPALMKELDQYFSLRKAQQEVGSSGLRLWRWCRVTAWRIIKKVMTMAAVTGAQACPRGLRHGFGVAALHAAVPLHLIQRWMGHARLATTAIYMDVCGPEEIAFAEKLWGEPPLRNIPVVPSYA